MTKKHAGGLGINDAKGFFESIIHTVAILVFMSFVLCLSHARLTFEILQVTEHYIKMVFGVLEHAYGIEYDGEHLQGTGKQNRLVPTTWTLGSRKMT